MVAKPEFFHYSLGSRRLVSLAAVSMKATSCQSLSHRNYREGQRSYCPALRRMQAFGKWQLLACPHPVPHGEYGEGSGVTLTFW